MKRKRKATDGWSAITVTRRLIQALFFVLMPALFVVTFTSLRDIVVAIVDGDFSFGALSFQLWVVAAVFPVTVIAGRFFCGYICAFGTMTDLLWAASSRLPGPRPRVGARADRVLRKIKYVVFAYFVLFVWIIGSFSIRPEYHPWSSFNAWTRFFDWPGHAALFTIGTAILLVIIIASFLVERFFCRYVCPLGALFGLVSRFRLFRVKKPPERCGKCMICTRNCPMGIPLDGVEVIDSPDCIDCFVCVDSCPRDNATTRPPPLIAMIAATVLIIGIYLVGDHVTRPAPLTDGLAPGAVGERMPPVKLADGTYTGSANGYRGTTRVEVRIAEGRIARITVLSTEDDRIYFRRAEGPIIDAVIARQSLEVDAVSGATPSSMGIIKALRSALVQAGMPEGPRGPATPGLPPRSSSGGYRTRSAP